MTVTPPLATAPLPESLAGKHVLVIGGTSGIGYAAADLLRGVGAHVAIGSRRGGKVRIDITDEASVTEAFAAIGALDHVLVTAGSFVAGPVTDLSPVDVRAGLLSRTEDAVRVVRAAVPTSS